MNEHEFRELLNKYEQGTLSKAEAELLTQFEKEIGQHSGAAFKNERHRKEIKKFIERKLIPFRRKEKLRLWRIAASVTLLFGLAAGALYFSDSSEIPQIQYLTKTTDWGEKRKLTLPDGSKVILNSGSSLSFPAQFANDSRTVKLKGEAFFDVVKNTTAPFVVHTDKVITTVLGTSFNINTQDNENISVTVATGKVQVAAGNNAEVNLTPKQQATYNTTTQAIETKEVSLNKYMDWKDGILRFDDVTLAEAALKLQQWYNVPIEVIDEDIANCRFSGKFNNERLHTVLKSFANLKSGLEYAYVDGGKIQLKGTCN